jgi:predicted Zn-ribbon and HTH transcriptional regulator
LRYATIFQQQIIAKGRARARIETLNLPCHCDQNHFTFNGNPATSPARNPKRASKMLQLPLKMLTINGKIVTVKISQ